MTTENGGSAPAGGIAADSGAAGQGGAAPNGAGGAPSAIELSQEQMDWLGTKGIKNFDAFKNEDVYKVAESYRETEKWALGGEKIVLPKEGAPQEVWDALFNKIGRPASPDGYKLQVSDKADEGLVKSFKEVAHKAGIPQSGLESVYAWATEAGAALEAQKETERQQAFNEAKVKLSEEWGKDSVRNADMADRGANAAIKMLGLEGEAADKFQEQLENGIGLRNAAVLMMKIAEVANTTGDSFEGGESKGGGNFAPSAKQAEAQIEALKTDRKFQERRRNGDSQAIAQWDNLHRIASGGGNFTATM